MTLRGPHPMKFLICEMYSMLSMNARGGMTTPPPSKSSFNRAVSTNLIFPGFPKRVSWYPEACSWFPPLNVCNLPGYNVDGRWVELKGL